MRRSSRANTLVIITALTLAILIAVAFFSLRYTRSLRANKTEVTQIEAAALTAAQDLNNIIVADERFGWISLSDKPEGGKATLAKDNFYLPVRGINTILATIRLDMILADQIGNPLMKSMAEEDLQALNKAREALLAAMNESLTPGGGSARDVDGNVVCTFDDALQSFETSIDARSHDGKPRQLVPDSLKITLGCMRGIPTDIPIPSPRSYAQVTVQQSKDKRYRAYTNIPYAGKDFVFAGVGASNTLVDANRFHATLAHLPYVLPSLILVEADQTQDNGEKSHVRACVEPGSQAALSPAPGRLTITMPDGQLTEFAKPSDFLSNKQMATLVTTTVSPENGDFPGSPLKATACPGLPPRPQVREVFTRALYDWLRRAGPQANVQSVIDMQNSPIAPGLEPVQSTITSYSFIETGPKRGSIQYSITAATNPYVPSSDEQILAVCDNEFVSGNGTAFDIVILDNCCRLGNADSGIHGGQPIVDQRPVTNQSLNPGAIIASAAERETRYSGDYGRGGIGATIVGPPSKGWDGEGGGWAYGQWKKLGKGGVHGGSNKDRSPELPPQGPTEGAARTLDSALVADISVHRIINSDAEDE